MLLHVNHGVHSADSALTDDTEEELEIIHIYL